MRTFLGNRWSRLNHVATDEGVSIGDTTQGVANLTTCKLLCHYKANCKSFKFGDKNCYFKDKCINPSEPQTIESGNQTHYKDCDRNITNAFL